MLERAKEVTRHEPLWRAVEYVRHADDLVALVSGQPQRRPLVGQWCIDSGRSLRTSTRTSRASSIGALSFGTDFARVLPWGLIDDRPFLRCLHGTDLCAWRLGDSRAAKAVFTKMLWLNPGDNQGARFNFAAIEAGKTWEEMEGDEA
jgi:hypothetical protein